MSAVTFEPPVTDSPLAVFESTVYVAPKVNLLPPEIGERRRLRKLQAGLAVGVLASGALVGLLYEQASGGKAAAQSRLDASQSSQTTLQAQTAKLAYVSAQKAQIDAARASLTTAMGSEVLWSKTLDNLRLRLPDGVRLSALAFTAVTPPASTAAGAAPATAAPTTATGAAGAAAIPANVIATATFTGKAVDLDAVATELDQLAKVPGLADVYLSSTTRGAAGSADQTASFTATANVTNASLSHRYDTTTGATK